MSGCLIRLDKNPFTRPIGIGETWQWCFEKCVLEVSVLEAKEAYGTEQIYGGLESVIEEVIHTMFMLWKEEFQEWYLVIIIVVVHNDPNEENQSTIMWDFQHYWTIGAQFAFNVYHHWATLVIRGGGVQGAFCTTKRV